MPLRCWNYRTSAGGRVEHLMMEQWNGGTVEHLMVEQWNRDSETLEHLMVEQWNSGTEMVEQWNI